MTPRRGSSARRHPAKWAFPWARHKKQLIGIDGFAVYQRAVVAGQRESFSLCGRENALVDKEYLLEPLAVHGQQKATTTTTAATTTTVGALSLISHLVHLNSRVNILPQTCCSWPASGPTSFFAPMSARPRRGANYSNTLGAEQASEPTGGQRLLLARKQCKSE